MIRELLKLKAVEFAKVMLHRIRLFDLQNSVAASNRPGVCISWRIVHVSNLHREGGAQPYRLPLKPEPGKAR